MDVGAPRKKINGHQHRHAALALRADPLRADGRREGHRLWSSRPLPGGPAGVFRHGVLLVLLGALVLGAAGQRHQRRAHTGDHHDRRPRARAQAHPRRTGAWRNHDLQRAAPERRRLHPFARARAACAHVCRAIGERGHGRRASGDLPRHFTLPHHQRAGARQEPALRVGHALFGRNGLPRRNGAAAAAGHGQERAALSVDDAARRRRARAARAALRGRLRGARLLGGAQS